MYTVQVYTYICTHCIPFQCTHITYICLCISDEQCSMNIVHVCSVKQGCRKWCIGHFFKVIVYRYIDINIYICAQTYTYICINLYTLIIGHMLCKPRCHQRGITTRNCWALSPAPGERAPPPTLDFTLNTFYNS